MSHIQHIHDEKNAWCGEPLPASEFYFKSLDQAILNNIHEGKKPICEMCTARVKQILDFRGDENDRSS